jgi:predicted negative regulator of RcsB-dependent stress response
MRSALAGRIAESEGDTVRAREAYAAALDHIDPARAPFTLLHAAMLPRYRLARLRLASGDTTTALALLEAQDFLSAYADQLLRGPVWLLHGRILLARGDTQGAARYFHRAADVLHDAEPPWAAKRDSARLALDSLGVRP